MRIILYLEILGSFTLGASNYLDVRDFSLAVSVLNCSSALCSGFKFHHRQNVPEADTFPFVKA